MMSHYEALAIAQLIFFAPALVVALAILLRHGRQEAISFTILLCLCRVIGSACGIAAYSNASTSETTTINLYVAYYVCSSIGISFLIQMLLSQLKRVNDGLYSSVKIPTRAYRLLSLPLLAGIILGAIAGSNLSGGDVSESDRNTAITESKAGSILFTLVAVLLAAITAFLFTRTRSIQREGDRTLLLIVAAALPFLAVRVIYGLCVSFDGANPGETFYRLAPNVWVEAFMSVMEEFIIVGLVLVAGILVSPVIVEPAQGGHNEGYREGMDAQLVDQSAKRGQVSQCNIQSRPFAVIGGRGQVEAPPESCPSAAKIDQRGSSLLHNPSAQPPRL
ncbi:hypothetical protein FH972_022918 [Carpinus fangiana]|uniref:DUF7702 domain-containing protein n=1 Tax=Carpinus fangiana TaxID=176857 RepID=A0A5N6KU62_9ROSI|nr:hypothetical protein FH972_022918 [Carpinus fangiana]